MDAERDVVFPLGSLNWDEKAVTLPLSLTYTKRCEESSQKMEKTQRNRDKERQRWKEKCRLLPPQTPESLMPASPWSSEFHEAKTISADVSFSWVSVPHKQKTFQMQ